MKKILATFVLWLGLIASACAQGGMMPGPGTAHTSTGIAVTNIGTNGGGAGTTLTITGVTVPSGSFIAVETYVLDSAYSCAGSVTDTASNTYNLAATLIPNNSAASNGRGCLFYVFNSTALSSGTITVTKGNNSRTVISALWANNIQSVSDPIDSSASAAVAFGSSTSPSTTSNAASVSGDLFLCSVIDTGVSAFTQDSGNGWAAPFNSVNDGASNIQENGGNQINGGTSAKTCAPTYGSSSPWAIVIRAFKHS